MSIEFAILGLLSWRPLSGYDLKKAFADSEIYYWSGNNNQIYKSLVALHKSGLVTQEVIQQKNLPAKKLYSITGEGRTALRGWVCTAPLLPEVHNSFLIQLAWGDMLSAAELDAMVQKYEVEVEMQVRMLEARAPTLALEAPNRTPRERFLWQKVNSHQVELYRQEWEWVRRLRTELQEKYIE
jgi:PadR family transcriptional regulator, regulatory protein AphA